MVFQKGKQVKYNFGSYFLTIETHNLILFFFLKSKHVKRSGTAFRVFEKIPTNQPGDIL